MAKKRGRPRKKEVTAAPQTVFSKDFLSSHRKSLIIGSIIVLLVVILASHFMQRNRPIQDQDTNLPTTTPTSISQPATASATPKATSSAEKTINPTPSVKPVVKTLPATHSDTIFYTVKKGDNLAKIGMRACGSKNAWVYIAEDNKLSYPYTLAVDQRISIFCR